MEKTGPDFYCPTCYKNEFRISRPRPEDRLQMLLLKVPVRCKNCRERLYAPRSVAKQLREAEAAGARSKTGAESTAS